MLRYALALLLLPALALAQAEESLELKTLGQCGLTTRYASSQIGDSCLTEAENIYLDEDAGISRRKGFAKYNATAITDAKSVRGEWPFRATDGTDYLVALSSETMFRSSGDGSFSAISPAIAGLSSTQDMDCAQCLGKLWCVNGSDTMFHLDGTSTGTVSGAPTCQAIDCFRNRVVVGNCSGTLSQLRMSGELDGTDFTIPSAPVSTSPVAISLGGVNDGNRLQCIMGAYQDVLVMGKIDSTWGLYGFDRRDFAVREISREVGCVDNRSSREKQGSLYWMSKRGIEKMTGPSITRVSDPIRDLMDVIIVAGGNSRSVTDTSQADFEAGNLTASGAGAPMSATIVAGSVVPSSTTILNITEGTPTLSGDVIVGSSGNITYAAVPSTYDIQYEATILPASDGWLVTKGGQPASESVSGGIWTASFSSINDTIRATKAITNSTLSKYLVFNGKHSPSNDGDSRFGFSSGSGGSTDAPHVRVRASGTRYYSDSTTVAFTESLDENSYSTYTIIVTTASYVYWYRNGVFKASATAAGTYANSAYAVFGGATEGSDSSGTVYLDFMRLSSGTFTADIFAISTFTSQIFNMGLSTPIFGTFTYSSTTPSGTGQAFSVRSSTSPNNDLWTSYNQFSGSGSGLPSVFSANRYIQFRSTMTRSNLDISPELSASSLTAATTGYFISQCLNPGALISSWGLMQCNQTLNDGTLSLEVSTGNTCNSVTRTTATWNTQANNSVIGISTASFVAYRRLFTIDSATQAPAHRDCTINWNEGTSRPSVSAEVYRDRYYLAYTSGTSGTVANDRLLVLDSRDQWTTHDQPNCSALTIYNRKLYCGDSSAAGRVYQMDVGQDDDGAAFTSNIKTKDFDMGNTFQRKELKRMYYNLSGLPSVDLAISLTPSYTLDASTDTFALAPINLNEDYSRFIPAKVPAILSNNVTGRWFSFSLSHTGSQGPWKLFGLKAVFSRLAED